METVPRCDARRAVRAHPDPRPTGGIGVSEELEADVPARWVGVLRGVAPLVLLTGCALSAPMPRSADFPFHEAAPPIDIHWRLSRQGDFVRAQGLAERRQPYVASAWLQLLELDASGRIVSFTAPTWVRWLGRDREPFAIRLQPRGGGERFQVRLYSFEYMEEVSP
jgi:hypothetical protein